MSHAGSSVQRPKFVCPSVHSVVFVQMNVMEQFDASIWVDHQVSYGLGAQACEPCRFSTSVREMVHCQELW